MTRHIRNEPYFVYDNIDILREARKEKGITRQALADITDIKSHNVAAYERGTYIPPKENYNKLAEFFGWQLWTD